MSPIRPPIIRRRRITAVSPTPEKLAAFLRRLEASGSVSFAARRTGVGRNTLYERREVDPAFASGWEKAMAMAVESLRDIVVARARDGDNLSDRSDDQACVEKNLLVQAGRRFLNFQTDRIQTDGV